VKIVSGGQTGVDRAALDVAAELGYERGGWCPRGRLAEDGALATSYPLEETPSTRYAERTTWNVRDSDGTLIVAVGPLAGGTALTARTAKRLGKPLHTVDLDQCGDPRPAVEWLESHGIRVLNVAGPRESGEPGIYVRAAGFLRELFRADRAGRDR